MASPLPSSAVLCVALAAFVACPRVGDEPSCLAKGGVWRSSGGKLGEATPTCHFPAPDKGKACRGGAECESRVCYLRGRPQVGDAVEGACFEWLDEQPFGCFGEVEDGRVTRAVCRD